MRLRLLPRTAWGRSAIVVGLAIFLSQLLSLWFFTRNAYFPGIREYAELTAWQVDMAVSAGDPDAVARLTAATGIEVVTQRPQSDAGVSWLAGPLAERFQAELVTYLDNPVTLYAEEAGSPTLWVSIDELKGAWVRVPMTPFRDYNRYLVLGWGIAVPLLAVLASLLIARNLNRPLKQLEHVAAMVGRGEPVPKLDADSGPTELNAVRRAFNQMAGAMQQAQQDRVLLLAGVSHDLRTPMTRLRLSAEFLGDSDMRAGIISDVEEMDAILDQFIGFIRDGADELPAFENLNTLIQEVAGRYQQADISLSLSDLPRLLLKCLTMKRLIANLIGNAIKYGSEPVYISTTVKESGVELCVRDQGEGICENDIPTLLEPFSRGEVARTLSGSGLGLAIVKRIVDMHHGWLDLHNHPEGGLEVRIHLPLTGQLLQPEALSARVR